MAGTSEPSSKNGPAGEQTGGWPGRVWRRIGQIVPWRDVFRLALAAVVACVVIAAVMLPWIQTDLRRLPVWGWVLALLPAAIVVYHAVFLHVVKFHAMRVQMAPGPQGFARAKKFLGEKTVEAIGPAYASAVREVQEYFSVRQLLVQYGIPALLNALVGLSVFYVLCIGPSCCEPHLSKALPGIAFGALGAYLCVLTQLGERTFREDITSGAAVWAAVQLTAGPVLGGIIGFLIAPSSQGASAAQGASAVQGTPGLTLAGLSFLAGFSPRFVLVTLLDKLRRLWVSPAAAPAARLVPLNQVRGITPAIEDRLNEEGIYDVYTLAGANPLRLLRYTSFDKRQVLDWIDEALLISCLPQNWQAIETEGMTGATDLAWCSKENAEDEKETKETIDYLNELAKRVKMDPVSLSYAADRLFQWSQVRLIWALYTLDSEEQQAATAGGGTS